MTRPLRILVCGGRDFADYRLLAKTLDAMTIDEGDMLPRRGTVIIHGGAPGADSLADQWAVVNWTKFEEYRADWAKHGRRAGPIRNSEMLKKGRPDIVVAFPGGRGTADMVAKARAAGVEVRKVFPE